MNMMTFFVIFAFLATVAVLFAGAVSMVRGGKFDWEHSGQFMEGRVLLQATALVLIVLAALFWT